jgi:hypothetical protein
VSDNPDHNLAELPAGRAGDADVVGLETRHLMVDIETLGTRPGSAIVSIGAVVFTPAAVVAEWECNVDLQSCMKQGLTLDASTIEWWMRQSDDARHKTFNVVGVDIVLALHVLAHFANEEHKVADYWSHGATFDLVLLNAASDVIGGNHLIKDFRRARDTRTLFEITGVNPRNFMGTGTAHNAVDDARAQALAVTESWRILRRWKAAASATQPAKLFTPWGAVGAS